MKKWMVGISGAKMHEAGHGDGGSPGAMIELEGNNWSCVGETLEAERNRLVREYRLDKAGRVTAFLNGRDEVGDPNKLPYERTVTHGLVELDGIHTELETCIEVNIPGLPGAARKHVQRIEAKALRASHRKLERLLTGRRLGLSFLTDSWHTPCFL